MRVIIGQIIGIIAVIICLLSFQGKTYRQVLTLQSLVAFSMMLHYGFLGAASGLMLNIVCLIRNGLYFLKDRKPFDHPAIPYILAVIMGVFGSFSWQGPISLFIIAGLMINTVFMSREPQTLRKSIILTSSLILIYDILVFSIGGIINEAVAIISSIIGIIRYRKTDKYDKVP